MDATARDANAISAANARKSSWNHAKVPDHFAVLGTGPLFAPAQSSPPTEPAQGALELEGADGRYSRVRKPAVDTVSEMPPGKQPNPGEETARNSKASSCASSCALTPHPPQVNPAHPPSPHASPY